MLPLYHKLQCQRAQLSSLITEVSKQLDVSALVNGVFFDQQRQCVHTIHAIIIKQNTNTQIKVIAAHARGDNFLPVLHQ